jgi:protein O-mannosyl-transferase
MTGRQPIDDVSHQPTAVSSPETETYFAQRPWLLALILAVVTFVAYVPAMRGGFIWDDDDHLTANPAMTTPHGLRLIWSSLAVSRYYPLTLTTFWVERHLWGLDPMPYHLVNIALHALNGVLVYFVLRRLRIPGPWLAAILWTLHPVNVESVAWITELKNTQSGAFFLLSLLCFFRFETDERRGWYALALGCGAAALLSKSSTVVLPVVLLLCAWWQRGRWQRADILRSIPFFGIAAGMSVLTIIEQRGYILRHGAAEWKLGITERFVLAGQAIWFYAGKLVWPVDLTFIYPRWELDARSVLSWMPLAGLVAAGVALWMRRRHSWARAVLFGLGAFVACLLPVLGFFDVFYFRFSYVADHFQYLASIGLIALVLSAGVKLRERIRGFDGESGIVVASITVVALGALTFQQEFAYRNVETIWRDTIAKNPQAWLAHNNLGVELRRSGRMVEAAEQYEEALRYNPDYAEAHNNLANFLYQQGDVPGAMTHWEQALRSYPNFAEAHLNFGSALVEAGEVAKGIAHYEQALLIKPDLPDAHCHLGDALARIGKPKEALMHYETALKLKPGFGWAQYRLARLLATLPPTEGGDPVRAVDLAQRACEFSNNRDPGALDTLGIAYAATGRFDAAIVTAQKAVDLARAAGQAELVKDIEDRLESYRSGRVYSPFTGVTSSTSP